MLTVQQSTTKAFNVYFGVSGLTVTATLSKNGGAFNSVSPTITDRSNGYYSIAPIAAHRDTIGENAWLFSASGQPSLPRVEQVIAANIDAAIQPVNVTQMAANVITSTAIADNAITDAKVASDVTIASVTGSVGSIAGVTFPSNFSALVITAGGIVNANVAAISGDIVFADTFELFVSNLTVDGKLSSTSFADNSITGAALASSAEAAIADAVWDEVLAGHLTAGTTGAALNASGGAGDPWSTTLPGAYTASQAGSLLADIFDKTAIITTGNVTVTAPVSEAGVITELILGDDYLAANGRALTWNIPEITGMSLANATAVFGMRQKDVNVTITGTVGDGAGATWDVTIEIANDDWGALAEGLASYSLEIKDSSNSREITRVINELGSEVLLRRKST